MSSMSMRGAGTIHVTGGHVSAMRITPSSITRIGAMTSLSSASARVDEFGRESGPGVDELGDLLKERALVFRFQALAQGGVRTRGGGCRTCPRGGQAPG